MTGRQTVVFRLDSYCSKINEVTLVLQVQQWAVFETNDVFEFLSRK